MKRHLRMGALPAGQAVTVLVSTAVFAILARTLGPEPFASFATAVFIFSVASLALDLSPQGYILVNPDSGHARRSALIVASIFGAVCAAVVFIAAQLGTAWLLDRSIGVLAAACLAAAGFLQMIAQVPRALLLRRQRYGTVALADTSSTVLAGVGAIIMSFEIQSVVVLTAQLAVGATLRTAFLFLAARNLPKAVLETSASAADVVRYGFRVMPINVGSYLSRSLDTGVLPGLIPAAAAAGYARSYQTVVAPLTQLQLALGPAIVERLARAYEVDEDISRQTRRIWTPLIGVAGAAALSMSLFSGIISTVLFGPEWPMANVFIAGMACALPAMANVFFVAWQLQVHASGKRSVTHLIALLISPIAVVVGALHGDVQSALTILVIFAAVSPATLLLAHRSLPLGITKWKLYASTLASWAPSAAMFFVIASLSGFWTFTDWAAT